METQTEVPAMTIDSVITDPSDDDHGPCRQELEASKSRFRALIAKNVDGMVVVGGNGLILFANPAAAALLGRAENELVGHDFGMPVVPGETVELDVPRDGQVRMAEMRVVETEWDGAPALLASLRDVTDRKRLEEELSRKIEALAEADRQKNDFLAMLAHELRNPLAPVRNAVRIMMHRKDDPDVIERSRTMIEAQVGHMTRLVDDLLDVSRITRGKIRLKRERVALARLVDHAVEASRNIFDAKRLRLTVTIEDDSIALEADATRLEQVLTNLLNNAAKFTDPGGQIRVEVSRDGDWAEIRVIDDGIGIAAEMLPRVFDLFAQADRSLDRTQGGLGIGLTLVRRLIELHGGTVTAESPGIGHGSRFTVRIPALGEHAPVSRRPTADGASGPIRHRLKILVVDDNVHSAETLAMLLKIWGHLPTVAHDGPEAIDEARAFCPEVVLLDIGLPRMDGYRVAQNLRKTPETERALLIALTGYGQDEDRRRAFEAGFDLHLVKPVDLNELQAILEQPERARQQGIEGTRVS